MENSGEYQFVFDVPDFRTVGEIDFPQICEIQLTAFASNDFKIFASEDEFRTDRELEPNGGKFVLFRADFICRVTRKSEIETPRPIANFCREIKEFELKTNELSGENFYWFLVETSGGEIDVVADVKLVPIEPQIGGIVSGQFWLSGKIIDETE